jgi:hypothetical protein
VSVGTKLNQANRNFVFGRGLVGKSHFNSDFGAAVKLQEAQLTFLLVTILVFAMITDFCVVCVLMRQFPRRSFSKKFEQKIKKKIVKSAWAWTRGEPGKAGACPFR